MDKVEDKWNRIYSEHQRPARAAAVLTDNSNILPVTGLALDLACGLGSNSLFLEKRGLEKGSLALSLGATAVIATATQLNYFSIRHGATPDFHHRDHHMQWVLQ